MLMTDGYIKLTDFGLSKKLNSNDLLTASFCGTPEILSPEVLRRKPYGLSVDLWALGSFVFELLTGKPPFHNKNREKL